MPLQETEGPNYTKVTKVYVDSGEREENSGSVYDYRFALRDEIQYVTGMELTSYSFPDEVTPSFRAAYKNWRGTNKIDFYIDDGTNVGTFTATWPQKKYVFSANPDVFTSYVDVLPTLLVEAIGSDPIFGYAGTYDISWVTSVTDDQTTRIKIMKSFSAPAMNWGFLFETGSNHNDAAYEPMGFAKADYSAISPNPIITSPNAVNLEPYRYFDLVIDEVRELNPVARIYVTSNQFYGISQNEINVSRTRLLSAEPLRRLKFLTVRLVLEGGIVLASDSSTREHDIGLTVFSVANENSVPRWITQTFVL